MAKYDPQDFESVILYMRHEFGASVFREASRMYAIFCDLSPKLKPYGKVFRELSERGIFVEMDTESVRQDRGIIKARYVLENELLLGVERVNYFLDVLRNMYGMAQEPTQPQPPMPQPSTPPFKVEPQPAPIKIIKHGECGKYGASVTFTLDENGVLTISGNGRMRDMRTIDDTPWWDEREKIVCAEIQCGVTSIGEWAFRGCAGLKSVAIPDGVTSIGQGAFRGCAGLESVKIPNSVTYIGDRAFSGCAGLTSVVIPYSVTEIEDWAFNGCTRLESVVISDSVTYIGNSAFYDCAGLTSVVIPDSVTQIGNWAFHGCTGLESVVIPDSVTYIGWRTFARCAGLTSVVIPDSVTYIEEYAFYGCENLKSVSVPAKAEIHPLAFPDTTRIERRA